MTHLVTRKRLGFTLNPIHRAKEPHAFHYLAQRTSFWLAILSLIAFVAGNMIGQHGWQVFWRSVMGRENDSAIVYTGTVTPIALVPDYARWAQYGGNAQEHTFREVPQNTLVSLPVYSMKGDLSSVFSVGYMGSYATGRDGSGSHPAVDIRVPIGTPVRAIANGIVDQVSANAGGFGTLVTIRHPNVPDPANSQKLTTLYSSYAHLSSTFVTEGSVVNKGEQIALSGVSGDASGPHLHFQIDRAEAPWHPYWPFNTDDLRAAGYSTYEAVNHGLGSENGYTYTVNPLLYVQANFSAVSTTIVENTPGSSSSRSSVPWISRAQRRLTTTKAARLARLHAQQLALATRASSSSFLSSVPASSLRSSVRSSPSLPEVVVQKREVVVSRAEPDLLSAAPPVATVSIDHDGVYSDRGWERVRLTLLDAQGNIVTAPEFSQDLVLRAAFGSAEFRPPTLSVLDFHNGRAEVNVLPHERRTLVIQVIPFNVLSQPLRYER